MVEKHPAPSFVEQITTRSVGRFYTWILAGLVILYLITFPIFKSTMLVSVPVIFAGWVYFRRGAILASILAVVLNLFLITMFIGELKWDALFSFKDGFLIGHIFIAVISITIGYLRGAFENLLLLNQRLRSQERFLTLSSMIIKKILAPSRPDQLFDDMVHHLTNLFVADYGYITRWDQTGDKAFLIAATNSIEGSSLNIELNPDEARITENVLQTGQVLLIENVQDTPYSLTPPNLRDNSQHARSAICLPLVAREYKFGTAILVYESPRHFTSEDRMYAERVGYEIALALWNFQQSAEIQQRLKESNALAKIGRALSKTEHTGTDKVLQLIVDSARELMPHAEKSVIHLLEAGEQALFARAVSGFSQEEAEYKQVKMRLGEGVAGQVIREAITINIGDVKTDQRFLSSNSLPTFSSLLVAPVQSGGKQIGTISVHSKKLYAFSSKDSELLNALGIQAALAIENTDLFESTQQRLKEIDALYKTSQRLAASLDADELINDVITLLQQSFGYYHVQIYLPDPSNGDLILKRGSGEIGAQLLEQRFRLSRGTGIIGHVAKTAAPFLTNDVNEVVFFSHHPLLPDTQSELAVPIKIEKSVVGVLDIQHTLPHHLTEGDLQLMTAVADQLAAALQKANLYSNLQTALHQEQTVRSQLIQSERLALVGRLLASVSHELNNPLQAIQNALFLLKDENLSTQASQDLDIILSETERMAALIERLRSAYGPVQIQDFRPVELNNLIEDVHALISPHMRQKEIAFEFIPDPNLPKVLGLSDQMRQVVLNLFFNAIEVMMPGGRLTVETRGLLLQKEVLLAVEDTGPGIDPQILPKIFDPFITSKHTGTGLGLTITHDIIEQHHGRITAENDPDGQGGAIFKVWLPIDEKGSK